MYNKASADIDDELNLRFGKNISFQCIFLPKATYLHKP